MKDIFYPCMIFVFGAVKIEYIVLIVHHVDMSFRLPMFGLVG